MPQLICDRLSFALNTQREYTDEGFLRVPGRAAKAGNVQEYYAKELGITDRDPMDIVRVYRPAEEVFKTESLESYQGADVTDNHPSSMVDADTYSKTTKGVALSGGRQDGDFVVVDLVIKDKDAIKAVEAGKVQLSAGYTADYEAMEGVSPSGEKYDYIQRNIKINHVALVDRARAGGQARLFDNKGDTKMPVVTLDNGRKVTLDSEANAALISDSFDRMQGIMDVQTQTIDEQNTKIKKLEAMTSDEAITERVAAITNTMDGARKIAGESFTCDSTDIAVIQLAALEAAGRTNLSGKSPAYMQGAFDTAIASYDMGMEEMREALKKKGADMSKVKDMSMKEMEDMMKEYKDEEKDKSDTNDSHRQFAQDADPKNKNTADGNSQSPYAKMKAERSSAWKGKE